MSTTTVRGAEAIRDGLRLEAIAADIANRFPLTGLPQDNTDL